MAPRGEAKEKTDDAASTLAANVEAPEAPPAPAVGFKPTLVKDSPKEASPKEGSNKESAKDSGAKDPLGKEPVSKDTASAKEVKTPSAPAPAPGTPAEAVPTPGPWRSYKEILAKLAQRVLDAQRPIRVLQALRWAPSAEEQFVKSRGRELPDNSYDPDLGFDPEAKRAELQEIIRDIERELGQKDELGHILRETTEEYLYVIQMLEARGTKRFYELSRRLYGSAKDLLPDGKTTVRAMGLALYAQLTAISCERLGEPQRRDIDAQTAALVLNERFGRFFGETTVRVEADDALVADAAAGSDYVKIRSGATFSRSDIDILEVHEGWVHLATSLNGQAQPVARWLAKGPPRTTAVQEGLAAMVEVLTLRSTPRRAKKLNDRVLAVDKAEDGASFLDIHEWYRTEGYDQEECFQNAMRIFRGGTVEGGAPFTKDACYCKGIVLNQAFMLAALQHDRAELIPFLFVGKVAHQDIPILFSHVSDGIVKPPPYMPPLFEDMNGLAVWLSYSSFFSTLCKASIIDHYASWMRR